MREVFESPGSAGGADKERAPYSRVLENKLRQRRLQMMTSGIPDGAHEADILVTDPRTGQSHEETWKFHGSVLTNVTDGDPRDAVHLRVILGIGGELFALHSPTSDPRQRMRCVEVTEAQLAEHTGIGMAVLAGFDRLIADSGSTEQPVELDAQSVSLPPNVILLDSRRGNDDPPDDTPA